MQAIIFSILNPLAFQPHLLNISSLSSAITSSQFIVFFSTWNENGICSALWPHFPPILMGQRMRNDGISNVVLYDADFWSVEQQELPWPGKKDPQKRNVSPLLPAPFRLYWSVECVIPLHPCPTIPNRSKKKSETRKYGVFSAKLIWGCSYFVLVSPGAKKTVILSRFYGFEGRAKLESSRLWDESTKALWTVWIGRINFYSILEKFFSCE